MYEQPSQPRSPGLWLGLSIAATLLCCWPVAIPGIVFAAQALQAQGRGDVGEARARVDRARFWTLLSIGLGVAFYVVIFGIALTGALSDTQ